MSRFHIVSSPCAREPGYPAPAPPPADRAAFDALASRAPAELRELGLRVWKLLEGGRAIWLFPGEWYAAIPAGFPVVGLRGERESFEPGKSDDDIRFGMLAYGIVGQAPPPVSS